MLARALGGSAPIDLEVSEIAISAYATDTPETLGERLYFAVMGKLAAKKLGDAAPEFIAELRKIKGDIFAADQSTGPEVAREVKNDLDTRIDTDFDRKYDAEAAGALARFFKKGLGGGRDVLDERIAEFLKSLEKYAGKKGIHLEHRTASGVPQVTPVVDNPFSIVYEEDPKVHKARHEAVHVTHVTQARSTVLGQLLERRRTLGLPASSVQDLSVDEIAEAALRLDTLEASMGNYPAFELAASNVGGAGGRKARTPSDYGERLKRVTSMISDGLSTPKTSISYYSSFGAQAIHSSAMFADPASGASVFISGTAARQKAWAAGTVASMIVGLAAIPVLGVGGGVAAAIMFLPPLLCAPLLRVKRTWKINV